MKLRGLWAAKLRARVIVQRHALGALGALLLLVWSPSARAASDLREEQLRRWLELSAEPIALDPLQTLRDSARLAAEGRYPEAERLLRAQLVTHPEHHDVGLQLARVLHWDERDHESLAVIEVVQEAWPESHEAAEAHTLALSRVGRRREASAAMREVERRWPDRAGPLRVRLLRQRGLRWEAREEARQLRRAGPVPADVDRIAEEPVGIEALARYRLYLRLGGPQHGIHARVRMQPRDDVSVAFDYRPDHWLGGWAHRFDVTVASRLGKGFGLHARVGFGLPDRVPRLEADLGVGRLIVPGLESELAWNFKLFADDSFIHLVRLGLVIRLPGAASLTVFGYLGLIRLSWDPVVKPSPALAVWARLPVRGRVVLTPGVAVGREVDFEPATQRFTLLSVVRGSLDLELRIVEQFELGVGYAIEFWPGNSVRHDIHIGPTVRF